MELTSASKTKAKIASFYRCAVLYTICDGILEPLGQSRVWRYLAGLSEHHTVILISHEKKVDWLNKHYKARVKAEVNSKGVI